ncbi:hypothetical protein D3C80_1532880 [compost metagenome]
MPPSCATSTANCGRSLPSSALAEAEWSVAFTLLRPAVIFSSRAWMLALTFTALAISSVVSWRVLSIPRPCTVMVPRLTSYPVICPFAICTWPVVRVARLALINPQPSQVIPDGLAMTICALRPATSSMPLSWLEFREFTSFRMTFASPFASHGFAVTIPPICEGVI